MSTTFVDKLTQKLIKKFQIKDSQLTESQQEQVSNLEDVLRNYHVDIEAINQYTKQKGKQLKGNHKGDCPLLHMLIENKEIDLVKKILKDNKNWRTKRANPDSIGPQGKTGLVYAIQIQPEGQQETITALLEAGCNPSEPYDGSTPLMWAVMLNQPETVKKLNDYLKDENTVDRNISELIYVSSYFNSDKVLQYLLDTIQIETIVPLDKSLTKSSLDQSDQIITTSDTPVIVDNPETQDSTQDAKQPDRKTLFKTFCSFKKKDTQDTFLHQLARKNSQECFRILLDWFQDKVHTGSIQLRNVKKIFNFQNKYGNTVLHECALNEDQMQDPQILDALMACDLIDHGIQNNQKETVHELVLKRDERIKAKKEREEEKKIDEKIERKHGSEIDRLEKVRRTQNIFILSLLSVWVIKVYLLEYFQVAFYWLCDLLGIWGEVE